ncbi:MAG: hypothetical protein KC613_23675 [Myxococcales bacterium]|nr:hypothetical protein [Myxococcales bacterium]
MTALLLALACLAAPPPAAPAANPTPSPALQTLLDRLGDALTRADGDAAAGAYDYADMLDEGVASGLMQPIPRGDRRRVLRGLAQGQARRAVELAPILNWQHTEILRAEALAGGRQVLTVRHRSERLNTVFRRRYWVRPGLLGWKIYDVEDVDVGVRTSEALAVGITAGRAAETPPWIPKVQALWGLIGTIQAGQVAEARATLLALSPEGLPVAFARTYWLLRVAAQADLDAAAALEDAAEAHAALGGAAPSALWLVAADARLTTGDAQGALGDVERFLQAFPGDPEALAVRGFARRALGQADGARADFDQALRAAPRLLDAWAGRLCLAPTVPLPPDLSAEQREGVALIRRQRCP